MNKKNLWAFARFLVLCQLMCSGAISNAAVSVPGKIEAEDYDGYQDSTWYNSGGKYRWQGVDIAVSDDEGGGYYVGWVQAGEYLHYNIEVSDSGLYQIEARVATPGGGRSFHFKLDGTPIGDVLHLPDTGGWQNWETVSTTADLSAGPHILEVYFENDEMNLNYVNLKLIQTPAVPVPGRIEAEDFNSWKDTTPGNAGGEYRQTDVDIERTSDAGGGYNVGWVAPGEFLGYSISVPETGTYRLNARVANIHDGRPFRFRLNGSDLTDDLTVPNTGGWQNWTNVSTTADLPAGEHELQVLFNGDEMNLNYIEVTAEGDTTPPPSSEWKLVWQDEFNGDSIDPTKWEHEVNAWGGGNNELQYYTDRPENSYVSNGRLVIQALRENYTGPEGTRDYTSGRLRSMNKGDFLYGKIEARARLPYGQGLWPAIWMLPTDWVYGGWAASGEIDIMEAVNLQVNGDNSIHGTLHYGGKWPNNTHSGDSYIPDTSVVDHFHVYSIEWEPGEIRWYVDGVHYQTQTEWWSEAGEYPAPFNQRFHLLLNVAVGGNWPGNPNNSTVFPQTMEVDYVRVYQKDEGGSGTSATLAVINNGGGIVTSQNNWINCGAQCTREFPAASEVLLTASAAEGFVFNGWSPGGLCKYEAAESSTCTIDVDPEQGDRTIEAVFVPDNSCAVTRPFGGTPARLPGRVEAENYDEGCAETAYSDIETENIGGEFRGDEVDIEVSHDVGGGYNLGWLRDGEWINYTVNVETEGRYDLALRIASEGNGSAVRFSRNGTDITSSISIPNTGDWQRWQTVVVRNIELQAGIQALTLHIDDGDFNLNYFEITSGSGGPFTVSKSRGEWTLVVIPDTQHYSQNRSNAPIAHMRTAFDWLVQVKDDLNIKFVQGLGDITESWNNRWEWDNSTSAWDKLYGQMPFMPIIGNHDDPWTMNQYFPVSSFSRESWWGGDFGGIENNFGLMTIGNEDYMFLQVETYDQYSDYRPAGMDWAKGILASYPDRKVILATHDTWATQHIRNNLLNNFDNIVMSNAGHVCQREAMYTTNGPRGGVSHNFIVDYQCDPQEVMLLRYYVFKPMDDRVDFFTYSPVTNQFEADDSSQGSFPLIQNDP